MISEQNKFLMRAASIASVCVASILMIIKAVAFYKTDAIVILAGLADSLLDLVASLINFFAVRYALNPADHDHRWGHGKAEALAGLAQSTLITTSVILLLIESVSRLMIPHPIQSLPFGIYVTIISIIMTAFLVLFQTYIIRKTGSLAIKSDRLHYQTDFIFNIAILGSLGLTMILGYNQIDAIVAIIVAFIILWGVKDILKQALNDILDKELGEDERRTIYKLATSHPRVKEIHDLRTRSSGSGIFVQFHMELPPETILLEAHRISDEVEELIEKHYDNQIEVFIHIDPTGYPRENPEFISRH